MILTSQDDHLTAKARPPAVYVYILVNFESEISYG